MDQLETKHIAIDTQFIVSEQFFQGQYITELMQHSKEGRIKLYMTDIIDREVLVQFREALEKIKSLTPSVRIRKFTTLKHFEKYSNYFTLPEIDIESDISDFQRILDSIKRDNRIEVISTDNLTIQRVMDDYFNRRAPFEKAKKEEFPDAFNLYALYVKFNEMNEKCYFLSSDGGVLKFKNDVVITYSNTPKLLKNLALTIVANTTIEMIEAAFRERKEEFIKQVTSDTNARIKSDATYIAFMDGYSVMPPKQLVIKDIFIEDNCQVIHAENGHFSMVFNITIKVFVVFVVRKLEIGREAGFSNQFEAELKEKLVEGTRRGEYTVKGSYNENGEIKFDSPTLMKLSLFPSGTN